MAFPALLGLLVFQYLPMAGIYIAFVDYRPVRGVFGSQWTGLHNLDFLFRSGDAWRITFNTVFMNSLFIVATLVTALALALMLNELRDRWKWLTRFYQSVLFLPYFFSYVIVSYFAMAFLDPDRGLVNHGLGALHMGQHNWYATPGYWPVILTIVAVWKTVGFWVIVYTAGILAIDPQLLEAAQIDGAPKWRQVYNVILPMLAPLIVVQVLLSIGNIFRADFGLFYLVTNNSTLLYPRTDVIDTYVYRSLTQFGDIGMASAAGVYQCVVGFVLVLLANWLVRRRSPENALY
ncbi:ABC transporter permease subunit [Streptomyces sp. NPDC001508]|uniref:ABC transporter permease n=1 Tax=Streptomyces sp. NPDC001508 TaxID=3154656 RepID=UPI00332F86B5